MKPLFDLLEIPSVSSDPARSHEVVRCASRVAELMKQAGLEARVLPTGGHPAVVGWWRGRPGAPTVLIYGHYDVQPEAPLELWTSPPFQPTVRDGKVYARGATDDKGQFLPHILAVGERQGDLPVNVVFLIEGEEEIGSPHLAAFVNEHRELLQADVLVVSDGAMFAPGHPSLVYGMRGACFVQVDLYGASRDLHSGYFGGAVPNPGFELARLLATLRSASGRVLVEGFYDRVREAEALPGDPAQFLAEVGGRGLFGEAGYSPNEQRTVRPTLELNGMLCGFTGVGAKTVLPREAMAKLTCRLVPDQVPEEIVELLCRALRERVSGAVRMELTTRAGGRPWVTPREHPAMAAATRALTRVYGRAPVLMREGGTIPIVADFQEKLGIPPLLVGFGLQSDNLHAPDEHMHLENFYAGIRASAALLEELAVLQTDRKL